MKFHLNLLSAVFIIIGLMLMVVGLCSIYDGLTMDDYEVPCYDRHNNEILGAVCIREAEDLLAGGVGVIIASIFIIFFGFASVNNCVEDKE